MKSNKHADISLKNVVDQLLNDHTRKHKDRETASLPPDRLQHKKGHTMTESYHNRLENVQKQQDPYAITKRDRNVD